MPLNKALAAELKHESTLTRKILERVPMDKIDWKPHDKSMTVGRLATHIAEAPHWASVILGADEFDFAANPSPVRHTASSTEELLAIFDKNCADALTALEKATDEDMEKTWTVKRGDVVVMASQKKVALRGWAFNHLYHHRGQLSVFIRLLDVSVPGMYGPSADER